MASEVRETLRELCCGREWSYGVLWHFDRSNPWLLTMEDSYQEEHVKTVIHKMQNQVHVVGEGSVGAVAMSGRHQWICTDAYCMEGELIGTDSNLDMLQGNAEWAHQFLSGLKTIVIISLPSLGVAQFGSSNKVSENLEFINQVKCLFQQVESTKETLLVRDAHLSVNWPREAFASVISSPDSYSTKVDDIDMLHDDNCKEQTQSLRGLIQSFNPSYLGSRCDSRSNISNSNLNVFAMPIISSSTYATNGIGDNSQKTSIISRNSCHLMKQSQEEMVDTQELSSNIRVPKGIHSYSSSSNNLADIYLNTTTWNKETNLLTVEQRLSFGMQMRGLPGGLPNSYSSFPSLSMNEHFQEGPTSFDSQDESTVPYVRSLQSSQECLEGPGMLLDYKNSSSSLSFSMVEGNVSTGKSSSQVPSFAPELTDRFDIPSGLAAEESVLMQPKEDAVDKSITDQLPKSDNLLISGSSGFVGDSAICAIPTTDSVRGPVENLVTDAMNSLNGGTANENSFSALSQSVSDNDLFDGMDLDLNPNNPGQESWDDILMPVGSNTCPSLGNSISECISEMDMGSIAGAGKDMFSVSGLEQLLEAVVKGHANLVSHQSSVATNSNSIASSDSGHQLFTNTGVRGLQIYRNEAPFMSLPCFSQKMDIVLPEYNLGRTTHKSCSEAHLVSSWISDSYSMNSASSVINQPKKPEEPVKVRKRARPGESTRPRPKDRQQIQDHVKELREIVPNGAKCSIDALLDRTIKHMLYLQSVTKYAEKLKQADEPKMIGDESGVLLKDNSGGDGGGATWAFEIAGQTMVCPIIVENVNPPGQMLVEMLCEDRGIFLEIADIIRGFGLTILKGVMEIHDSKIWARFLVEANRDVTRMDIFLSLVQLLQQTAYGVRSSDQPNKVMGDGTSTLPGYQQSPLPIPITLADTLR